MPNTNPATTSCSALEEKRALALADSRVNFGFWAGAQADNHSELRRMIDCDDVVGIKLYLCDTTNVEQGATEEAVDALLVKTHGIIGIHAEHEHTLHEARKRWAGHEHPSHNDVRPPAAAESAVKWLLESGKRNNRHIHVCHMTTGAEMRLVDEMRPNMSVSCEVSPNHLSFSVEQAKETGLDDRLLKCNPPIRPESDRRALWAGITDGRIDFVASDHAPHTLQQKTRAYWEVPSGMPGVETLLRVMMRAVQNDRITIERLVEISSAAPAKLFGLQGKGIIEVGADADLVLLSEHESAVLSRDDVYAKVGWSPLEGRTLSAPPSTVVVGGKTIARKGRIVNDEVRGGPLHTAKPA
jgi:dihydroorotase